MHFTLATIRRVEIIARVAIVVKVTSRLLQGLTKRVALIAVPFVSSHLS